MHFWIHAFKAGLPEVDQERMLKVLHYLQLFQDIPHFVPLHAFQLVHVLHGVHLLSVLLLYNADLMMRLHNG